MKILRSENFSHVTYYIEMIQYCNSIKQRKLVSNARKVMAKEGVNTIIAAGCGAVKDKSRKQTKLT